MNTNLNTPAALPTRTEVAIVGAGPTGLALAVTLVITEEGRARFPGGEQGPAKTLLRFRQPVTG